MNWLVKRVFRVFLTVWAVATLTFVMIRELPGGPVQYVKAQLYKSSDAGTGGIERVQKLAEATINFRTDEPLHVQYWDYMSSLAVGDFGTSVWFGDPVSQILAKAAPWTVFLMGTSILFFFGIGISLGALMAYKEASLFDKSTSILSTLLSAVPFYIMAIVFVWILGYQMSLFPVSGRVTYGVNPPEIDWFVSIFRHATLPIISVVLAGFGNIALQMRGNSISVLGKDYMRVGRLRGLSDSHLAIRYVGQNAILPMYTSFMISIGFMFGGSVVLERIFTYPGLGLFLFRAINARDYPLMMGTFILITTAVAVGILIADLSYGKIDPRASVGESNEAY
jgi:peptide/nickel transport system permease protein